MNSSPPPSERDVPQPQVSARVGAARLGIGLLQGLALYLLYRAVQDATWPANVPLLFAPLLLVALLVPVILGASLGQMHARQALAWTCASAVIIAALGVYDIWRNADQAVAAAVAPATANRGAGLPSPLLFMFTAVGFFIAHALVAAAVRERRRIASYPAYFETAWMLAVQLAFSALFVGVVWLVLVLGAQLFMLVKLRFLEELIKKAWFAIPVSTLALACAMHLTDVRPAIVRGIRSLLLVLMSWVLPVMTLIVGGFIASLPFTGLAPLWATRHAVAVLLGAAAAFVVLVNAAYQDGDASASVAPVIRVSARAASILLVPLTAIAVYALALRVGDYGWTSERIIAAACLLVASCYALGYAASAASGRLAVTASVNVATAFVVLATLLALFSPVADPARLSVNNQLARLAAGKVSAAKFDFVYLRFEGARYGREALARLDATATGPDAALVRARIAAARTVAGRWQAAQAELAPANIAANLQVWPHGARLPDSFLRNDWSAVPNLPRYPECLQHAGQTCDAYLLDLSGDGKPEIVVIGTVRTGGAAVLGEDAHGKWGAVGKLPFYFAGCASIRKSLIAGNVRAVQPVLRDLDVAGQQVRIEPGYGVAGACPGQ
jgi:hypothetical protein